MDDIAFYIVFLLMGIFLIPFAFWIDKKNSQSAFYKEHPEKLKKPWHKRWWMYLVAVIMVIGSVANMVDPKTYQAHKPKQTRLASDKEMQKDYKKISSARQQSEKKAKEKENAKKLAKENKSLRKETEKEHLATLKKKLSSLNADKYNGNTISKIDVSDPSNIQVTLSSNFIKNATTDERKLIIKSIADDIENSYNRYAPYPNDISEADISFTDSNDNDYGTSSTH